MAKVKFGAIVTDMRNKLGSQVYSKNRYGSYARSYKATLTSNTTAQQIVKNRMSGISASWKTLSQAQRDSWNAAVSLFTSTDIFGDVIRPTGLDLFVKLNSNLDQIGEAMLTLPPSPGEIGSISQLSVSAIAPSISAIITFLPSTVPTGFKYIITATACISPGIQYIKNLVRAVEVIDAGTASPYNFTTAYLAKFGNIYNTFRISVQIIVVNKSTGQKSKPFNATCIVGGTGGLDIDQALDTGIPLA